MATMAQHFLDGGPYVKPSPHDRQMTDALTLEYTTANDYAKMADRVVFDEELLEVYHQMIDDEQIEANMIFRNVRLPSDRLWVEWRALTTNEDAMQVGALFEMTTRTELPIDMIVMCRSCRTGGMGIVSRYKIDPPPYAQADGLQFKMTWSDADGTFTSAKGNPNGGAGLAIDDPHDPRWGKLMSTFLKGAFFGLFLLQQPRVTDVTEVKHPEKVQAKRRKHGKKPLVEYRRVKLKVGVVAGRTGVLKRARGEAAAGDGAGGGKKKYHHVMGHFRCYHRDEPNEIVVWIAEHYRGDPALGFMLREKHLVAAQPKD